MIIRGTAFCLGDNVSTDEILPGRYMGIADPLELAQHALAGLVPPPSRKLGRGDIIVAGANFGTGSSRQQAPQALRLAGVTAIVGASYGRLFYRNCVNIGMAAVWSPDASAGINDHDEIEIDLENGLVSSSTSGCQWSIAATSEFVRAILAAGGLVNYARDRVGGRLVPDSDVDQP